ncbi:MAG TPA: VCBS repeat-containing protein [Thermoanaerobaculia bacterium]|jgi:hypothetical protein|nr:VCBS repeat-containing protein [Thermoanaerobaculia bacterium]
MVRRRKIARASFASLTFLAALALVATGCASQGSPNTSPKAASDAARPAPAVTPAPSAAPAAAAEPTPTPPPPSRARGPEPPDGKWSSDPTGRQFFPYEIPKIAGHYEKLPDNQIRIDYGQVLDVMEERPNSFVVKIYRMDPALDPPPPPKNDAAKLKEIAATYESKAAPVDRLTFSRFDRGLPTRGQWRQGFVVMDYDGDGHLDIVHGPPRKGVPTPRVFLGDGKGNWRMLDFQSLIPLGLDYGQIAVADFNGDGKQDFALAVHLRGLKVLVADGNGGFTDWSQGLEYQISGGGGKPPEFTSRTIQAVDWNHDGKMDILALGEGPRMTLSARGKEPTFDRGAQGPVVYLNHGDGSWERKDEGTGRDRVYGDVLRIADINRDGHLDFVTGSSIGGYKGILHLGRADGGWDVTQVPTLRLGMVTAVAVEDFNRDGLPDLAVGFVSSELGVQRGGIDVHFQMPGGEWRRVPLEASTGTNGVTAAAAGDVDGDGAPDIVATFADGERMVFLGDGRGNFADEHSPELSGHPSGCRGYHVELTDLDGDGRDEAIMDFAGEPGSEVALGAPAQCPGQGSLEVWKAAPLAGG